MSWHTAKQIVQKLDSRLNGFAKLITVVGLFACLFLILNSASRFVNGYFFGIYPSDQPLDYTYISVSPNADMEVVLKRHNLWDIDKNDSIAPVVFNSYPAKSALKQASEMKRIFFHVLLPAALIAQEEVNQERQLIIEAIAQIGRKAEHINFDPDEHVWKKNLSRADRHKLLQISEKYKDRNAASLLKKVDVIPVSLILAQSAIESAWGGSRFAVDGNNLFGIWTWGENGMVPHQRSTGKKHKVAVFVSILDSVRAYTLMLNRLPAYQRLRDIRSRSKDPLELAEGLINYSSRRSLYVNDVKRIIKGNKLKRYDSNSLGI